MERARSRLQAILIRLLLGGFSAPAALAGGPSGAPAPSVLRVPETTTPVHVDGVLDDEAWSRALLVELPYEIDPGENVPAKVRTECLLASDEGHLYVGCRAQDPDPGAIRAHYQDRDTAWDDDWILLSLDSFGDQRRAFEFLVNPLGVQMDTVLNEVTGGGTTIDSTWDAIWRSAGRVNASGYDVEMALPFTSLRFPRGGGEQRWGFQAVRHYPRRFSCFFRTAPWDRNRGCTLCESLALVGFTAASPGRNLELDPTFTVHRTDLSPAPAGDSLESGPIRAEPGLSVRWGMTPNLSFNAALNPDFSQVEADAAQLDVNVRFALYYPEKRPFFLEAGDLFKTPLDVVYTRTVADPRWGLKLTGKEGGHALGALVVEDDQTNLLLPGNQTSRLLALDQRSTETILRYRRDLGERSTVGLLLTDRRGGGYASTLAGVDGFLSPSLTESLTFQLLRSETTYPASPALGADQPPGPFGDWAARLGYRHESRNWHWWGQYESLGRRFRADAGFLPRVDTRTITAGLRRVIWPAGEAWFSRVNLTLEGQRIEDQSGRLNDRSCRLSAEWNGPQRSTLALGVTTGREVFAGTAYDGAKGTLDFSVRPGRSLTLTLAGSSGRAIDYLAARAGNVLRIGPGLAYFFGRHLQLKLDHSFERLDTSGGQPYRAHLAQARLDFQANTRAFVRALVQYLDLRRDPALYALPVEPSSSRLFMQWLFTYKVNPQTVLFLGYSDTRGGEDRVGLGRVDRTFFAKIGYAWLP
jgi:hypothetical protein